ncbi:MAG: hypothetical protein COX51_03190, partial [Syntrophobacteraceae bacterium CG23_combo_of_CG06-09_8_20_14_all_50_8]
MRNKSLTVWHRWRRLILLRVGNDIVDLTHPHAKGKSRDLRFLKRVFLPDEERQILASHEPDTMLWTLWTGKEAAYKVT